MAATVRGEPRGGAGGADARVREGTRHPFAQPWHVGADDGVDELAIAEELERGHALDSLRGREVTRLVHVHFEEDHLTAGLACELVDHRREHLAGLAPLSMKVDHYQPIPCRLERLLQLQLGLDIDGLGGGKRRSIMASTKVVYSVQAASKVPAVKDAS
eukprot:scaffold39513_cov58-Phaeocystis_antarctica.AAC.2